MTIRFSLLCGLASAIAHRRFGQQTEALQPLWEDMSLGSDLRFGPLSPNTVHLCVDMQTLFAERTDWHVPWLERVLPTVIRLAEARRERSVFTRFVPPERPEEAVGAWRRYYEHWRNMTGEQLNPRLIELVPPLAALALPELVIDKVHYSPFEEEAFLRKLGQLKPDALVISGGETDVCVLTLWTHSMPAIGWFSPMM